VNEKNTLRLLNAFPSLYAGHTQPPSESLMCFGFECGDGWFQLIWDLSEKLEAEGIVAVQVKEKFGSLRFYTDTDTDAAYAAIEEASEKSSKTCELCGAPGEISYRGYWLKALCETCRKEYGYDATTSRK